MNTKLLKFLALAAIPFISSCTKDPLDKAEELPCQISNNLLLKNHNTKGVDYICNCEALVTPTGTLTIEPGVEIVFKTNSSLTVEGLINAVGSAEKIHFNSEQQSPGAWKGIFIKSANVANILQAVIISNAGSSLLSSSVGGFSFDAKAALNIYNGAKISLSDVNVNKSAGLGIFVAADAELLAFNNIGIENCADYPIMMYAGHLSNNTNVSMPSITAVGNSKQFYCLFSETSNNVVARQVLFRDTDVPYFVYNDLNFNAGVVVNEGVEIVMASNTAFICDDSYMTINGTAANPVTIRGLNNTSGYWKGILVRTNNTDNVFNYLNVSGGGSEATAFGGVESNISVGSIGTAQLTINNCNSTLYDGYQAAASISDGTLTNNSPSITVIGAY